MSKITNNRFVLFGAIAAAALVMPGVVDPLMFEEAYAQTAKANQRAEGVVAANVAVQAQNILNNNDVTVCIISADQSCR